MSLFKFAEDPAAVPNPLPPLEARRSVVVHGFARPGAWPVALLPAGALAVDLVALGVAFQRGSGYAADGRHVEPHDVAFLAATVLEAVADELPWRPKEAAAERLRVASEQLEIARNNTLDRMGVVADATVDPDPALMRSTYEMSTYSMRRLVTAARRDLDRLPDDVAPSWRPFSFALMETAADLRASARSRRLLLDLVRPYLPAPSAAPADAVAVESFLAQFDGVDALRRSELSVLYSEAGRPGGLAPADLRQAAADRWGAPRQVRGIYTYRPARSLASVGAVS